MPKKYKPRRVKGYSTMDYFVHCVIDPPGSYRAKIYATSKKKEDAKAAAIAAGLRQGRRVWILAIHRFLDGEIKRTGMNEYMYGRVINDGVLIEVWES